MNLFKAFAKRNWLILKKGENVHIFIVLLQNLLLSSFLRVKKFFTGTKKPIIHYYCIAWNESKILPFIFQYYKDIVEKFYIYDNESTDNTFEIINQNQKATLVSFSSNSKFNDEIHIDLKNSIWKNSRGKADYVIVCDADEFLYHENLSEFLLHATKIGYSFFCPFGYDMYSDKFPVYKDEINIVNQLRSGILKDLYSKSIIFDPHKIVDINYTAGAHTAMPLGIVRKYNSNDLKLLHYKNLGIDYVLGRIKLYRNRLSDVNKEKGYGLEYLDEDIAIKNKFEISLKSANKVI